MSLDYNYTGTKTGTTNTSLVSSCSICIGVLTFVADRFMSLKLIILLEGPIFIFCFVAILIDPMLLCLLQAYYCPRLMHVYYSIEDDCVIAISRPMNFLKLIRVEVDTTFTSPTTFRPCSLNLDSLRFL